MLIKHESRTSAEWLHLFSCAIEIFVCCEFQIQFIYQFSIAIQFPLAETFAFNAVAYRKQTKKKREKHRSK